jgi:hypothetical protein
MPCRIAADGSLGDAPSRPPAVRLSSRSNLVRRHIRHTADGLSAWRAKPVARTFGVRATALPVEVRREPALSRVTHPNDAKDMPPERKCSGCPLASRGLPAAGPWISRAGRSCSVPASAVGHPARTPSILRSASALSSAPLHPHIYRRTVSDQESYNLWGVRGVGGRADPEFGTPYAHFSTLRRSPAPCQGG